MDKKPKVIIYIDGFNLYNGIARADRLNCKWVDIHKFFACNQLVNHDIVGIKFFTAPVLGPTIGNQLRYIKALETIPNLKVIQGCFQRKTIRCRVAECGVLHGSRKFERPSEKKTDVAIASAMFEDAINGSMDEIALVSGDSDFVPAIESIRRCFPALKVNVFVPTMGKRFDELTSLIENGRIKQSSYASELRKAAHKHQDVNISAFLRSQFPDPVIDANGKEINMPDSWLRADNRTFTRLMDDLENNAKGIKGYQSR